MTLENFNPNINPDAELVTIENFNPTISEEDLDPDLSDKILSNGFSPTINEE